MEKGEERTEKRQEIMEKREWRIQKREKTIDNSITPYTPQALWSKCLSDDHVTTLIQQRHEDGWNDLIKMATNNVVLPRKPNHESISPTRKKFTLFTVQKPKGSASAVTNRPAFHRGERLVRSRGGISSRTVRMLADPNFCKMAAIRACKVKHWQPNGQSRFFRPRN